MQVKKKSPSCASLRMLKFKRTGINMAHHILILTAYQHSMDLHEDLDFNREDNTIYESQVGVMQKQ
jgi:hypothetical protein